MSRNVIAYAELTAAMAIVGSSVVVGKLITAHLPVFLASTLRLALALPILIFLTQHAGHNLRKLNRADLIVLFFQALTGVFLFNALLLYALHHTTAAESGIITSSTPAIIALISWLFLRERLSMSAVGGILLTVCGVLAINLISARLDTRQPVSVWGMLLVFGAVIGEALFTIFRKMSAERVTSLPGATFVTGFGLLLFLPMGVYEALSFDFTRVSLTDLGTLVYYSLSVTVLAYILWFRGVEKVPASTAAVFTGVMPISTVALSALILGEQITSAHLVGLACVLGGIGLITRPA